MFLPVRISGRPCVQSERTRSKRPICKVAIRYIDGTTAFSSMYRQLVNQDNNARLDDRQQAGRTKGEAVREWCACVVYTRVLRCRRHFSFQHGYGWMGGRTDEQYIIPTLALTLTANPNLNGLVGSYRRLRVLQRNCICSFWCVALY